MIAAAIGYESIVDEFIFQLELRGALAVQVPDIDDLIVLYHKSGGGMEGVVNTIGEIGELTQKRNMHELAYQIWVRAHHAARDGEMYIAAHPAALHCETLVVVIDAENIECDGNAHSGKRRHLFGETLGKMTPRPSNIVVYIINKNYQRTEGGPVCGPGCRC